MSNGKDTTIRLIVAQIKKTVEISEYFPKPKSLGANVRTELDLSNYATKADLQMQQELIHKILLKRPIQLI